MIWGNKSFYNNVYNMSGRVVSDILTFSKIPKIDQKVKANPFAFCRILVILHKLEKGLSFRYYDLVV